MKKIICIGSATKDIFLNVGNTKIVENKQDITAQKLFAFEFGAKVYAQGYREELGGSAVNVATGLAECDMKTFVFARSSKSETGKWIVKQIGKRKLKKNYFQQTGGNESEISVVISDKKHKDHVIFRTGDSIELFDVAKALKKFREKADWIYVGSQKKNWKANFDQIAVFAKKKKAKIALSPSSFQLANDAKELASRLKLVEVLFLNRDEALELVKNVEGSVQDDIGYLFEKILNFAKEICVITDGENGAYVGQKGFPVLHIPTQAVEVNDTVGAGDAFASGFLANYIESGDAKKALTWGIANSASVLAKEGATNGLLKKKELKRKENDLLGKVREMK